MTDCDVKLTNFGSSYSSSCPNLHKLNTHTQTSSYPVTEFRQNEVKLTLKVNRQRKKVLCPERSDTHVKSINFREKVLRIYVPLWEH